MTEADLSLAPEDDSQEYWTNIADFMSGLMMIFMFIAVAFMVNVKKDQVRMEDVARTYQSLRYELYGDLQKTFAQDLATWNAEIDSGTLTVRFREPEVFFDDNSASVKPRFAVLLADFFPRYVGILTSEKYAGEIDEIRIEGHTSSGAFGMSEAEAYIYNMKLSQDRTRSVLGCVLGLDGVAESRPWLTQRLTANGLSSSRVIETDGREDRARSRRVEFRIRTDAEARLEEILTREGGPR